MKAVVYHSMIKAVSDGMLENDVLVASIATFVSSYVENKWDCVKVGDVLSGLRREIRTVPHSPPTLDPSNDGYIISKKNIYRRVCRDNMNDKKSNSSTSFL